MPDSPRRSAWRSPLTAASGEPLPRTGNTGKVDGFTQDGTDGGNEVTAVRRIHADDRLVSCGAQYNAGVTIISYAVRRSAGASDGMKSHSTLRLNSAS